MAVTTRRVLQSDAVAKEISGGPAWRAFVSSLDVNLKTVFGASIDSGAETLKGNSTAVAGTTSDLSRAQVGRLLGFGYALAEFGVLDNAGVNTASNNTALTAFLGDATAKNARLGIGNFNFTTRTTKPLTADGKIKYSGQQFGNQLSYITTKLTSPATLSSDTYLEADTSHCFVTQHTGVGTQTAYDLRNGWNQNSMHPSSPSTYIGGYYHAGYVPNYYTYDNFTGHSGISAYVAADPTYTPFGNAAGGTTLYVNVAGAELVVGRAVRIYNGTTGAYVDRSITAVSGTAGGPNTLTLSGGTLAIQYSSADGSYVAVSERHMNSCQMVTVNHHGGGDCYAHLALMTVYNAYNKNAGQNMFFATATGGLYGGLVYGAGEGVFLTGLEVQYEHGAGLNVGAVHQPLTFTRNTDSGTFGQIWGADLVRSIGTQSIDFGWALSGNAKRGLDLVRANLGTDQAAINLGAGQRIYFNSSSTANAWGLFWYGNVIGNSYISKPVGDKFKFYHNAALALEFDAANLIATGYVTATRFILGTGQLMMFEGAAGDTYIYYSSALSALRKVINGVETAL